jgi:hypothetical protein
MTFVVVVSHDIGSPFGDFQSVHVKQGFSSSFFNVVILEALSTVASPLGDD